MVGGEVNDGLLAGQPVAQPKRERRGGRKRGTPNKATAVKKTAAEICAEMGIDPIQSMCWVLQGKDMATGEKYVKRVAVVKNGETVIEEYDAYDESTKTTCLKELACYVQPKKKAIEHTGGDGKPLAPPELHIHFV